MINSEYSSSVDILPRPKNPEIRKELNKDSFYEISALLKKIMYEKSQIKTAREEIEKMSIDIKNELSENQEEIDLDFLKKLNIDETNVNLISNFLKGKEKLTEEKHKSIIEKLISLLNNVRSEHRDSTENNIKLFLIVLKAEKQKTELINEYENRMKDCDRTIDALENILFPEELEKKKSGFKNNMDKTLLKLYNIQKKLSQYPENLQSEIYTQFYEFLVKKEEHIKNKINQRKQQSK